MQGAPSTVVILGIPFHNVTFAEAVAWARQRILSRQPGYIATANMDFVMQSWRDPELQRILLEADLVVADGIPIVWLSALLGPRLKARVTGSDLVPLLAEMARDNGFSLYHLGGAPGVPEQAAETLVRRFPGLRMAGCYSPPKADILTMDHGEILARLQAAKPDLLLVAFGAPKQEKWVNLHVRRWKVPLAIGVGGSLDFLAGVQTRAPRIVQRLALEWFWRMCSDPPRLVGRYLGNIAFFFRALCKLLLIRCRPDRAEPPVGADSALRRMAHVETFVRLSNVGQADAFCVALIEQAVNRPVVLDLGGVPWLSSLEQGALLRLTTQFRRRQQPCMLTGAGSRVRRLLNWCHLAEYLEVGFSIDGILGKIEVWNARSRTGSIHRDTAGRIVVQLPVELTAANLDAVRKLMDDYPGVEQTREQILDATETRFVDSSAIGYFMRLKKQANAQNSKLRLVGAQPSVRRIFHIAKVDAILLDTE
jgi:N-acetylglucosaminyldiphosphoundecaprenol N-acetyl-beta-D-mannosaminyltransferase